MTRVAQTKQESGKAYLAILNTTIVTAPGRWVVKEISSEQAILTLAGHNIPILSAIGHEATAQAASELLGIAIPVNRIQYVQGAYDIALCLKIKGRLPEGVVLTREEMDKIGYSWWVMYLY